MLGVVPTITLSDIVPPDDDVGEVKEAAEGDELEVEGDDGDDVDSYTPSIAPHPVLLEQPLDFSLHTLKKSAAEGMLDMALLMANASQLKFLILTDGNHRFYWTVLTLLIASISLQLYTGICLIILVRIQVLPKLNEKLSVSRPKLPTFGSTVLNDSVVCAIFLITILNVLISAFGINDPIAPHFPKYYDPTRVGNQTVYTI